MYGEFNNFRIGDIVKIKNAVSGGRGPRGRLYRIVDIYDNFLEASEQSAELEEVGRSSPGRNLFYVLSSLMLITQYKSMWEKLEERVKEIR